jgi:hypothetical protein
MCSGKKRQCSFYEFIRECYVHGMMDGEALKASNPPPRELIIV